MTYALVLAGVALLYLLVRALHLASVAAPPSLIFNKSSFNDRILAMCPMLLEMYMPPLFWGKSGHLQTILYAKLGRVKSPYPLGDRLCNTMTDGATSTFDVFPPIMDHSSKEDLTLAVCPGIANHSQSHYIRTFVHHAQLEGYRVAVLNHLGALPDVRLTSPRIYTYGGTEEYGAMVRKLKQLYPDTSMISVGFSMGGNIVTKYIGESVENEKQFLCAVSCCQGYDCRIAVMEMSNWEHFRRVYNYAMTQHQKCILRQHHGMLFGLESQKLHGQFDLQAIKSCTKLFDLDECYSRRRAGYDNIWDYYAWASCSQYIKNIQIPMFILNAKDDPICPAPTLVAARKFAETRNNVIYCLTEHGGHLGYFEGGLFFPETLTWMDKVVIQYTNAVVKAQKT